MPRQTLSYNCESRIESCEYSWLGVQLGAKALLPLTPCDSDLGYGLVSIQALDLDHRTALERTAEYVVLVAFACHREYNCIQLYRLAPPVSTAATRLRR